MHVLQPRELFDGDLGATANSRGPVMWLRSRSRPLRVGEVLQAVVVFAFAIVIPILLLPTIVVFLVALLDRLGLTLLGKIVVLVVIGGACAAGAPMYRLLLLVFVRLISG